MFEFLLQPVDYLRQEFGSILLNSYIYGLLAILVAVAVVACVVCFAVCLGQCREQALGLVEEIIIDFAAFVHDKVWSSFVISVHHGITEHGYVVKLLNH